MGEIGDRVDYIYFVGAGRKICVRFRQKPLEDNLSTNVSSCRSRYALAPTDINGCLHSGGSSSLFSQILSRIIIEQFSIPIELFFCSTDKTRITVDDGLLIIE